MLTDDMRGALDKIIQAHRELTTLVKLENPRPGSAQAEYVVLKSAWIGRLIAKSAQDYGAGFFVGLTAYYGPETIRAYLTAYKLSLEYLDQGSN